MMGRPRFANPAALAPARTEAVLSVESIAALVQGLCAGAAYAGIGSRETPLDVQRDMTAIARALAKRGLILRSGGAGGADLAFESGTASDSQREIFLPWKGFNRSASSYHPDNLPADIRARAASIAEQVHPAWERCSPAAKKLHTRNVYQVLGQTLGQPVACVICWTSDGKASGGTGQAIRIAQRPEYDVPVINLHNRTHRSALLKALGMERTPQEIGA